MSVNIILLSCLASAACPALRAAPPQVQGVEVRTFREVRGVPVRNRHEDLGVVADFVVALPAGRLVSAVVAVPTAKKTRWIEVPYDAVDWDTQNRRALVDVTKKALEAFVTLDPTKLGRLEPLVVPAKGEKGPAPAPPQAGPVVLAGKLLLSQLAAIPLSPRGAKRQGRDVARSVAVELSTGAVAFLVLSDVPGRAGDINLHPVPWSTCKVMGRATTAKRETEKETAKGKAAKGKEETGKEETRPFDQRIHLSVDNKRIASSPCLTAVHLNDPLYRTRIYRFFDVPMPAFELQR